MSKWMFSGSLLLVLIAVVGIILWLVAHARYRSLMDEAEIAWSDIRARARELPETYASETVAELPEIAQRYFSHAIAPGTPLYQHVVLAMSGDFLLGEKDAQQTYAMRARQILAPPHDFVWIARMSKGLFRINGSDGFHDGHGWTRFWMLGALPLVQLAATTDLDRAAAARPAIEAIWAPATLLPLNGARWVQTGPDTADITFGPDRDAITISLRINADGGVKEVWTQRWSDSNPSKTFELQPFGGIIEAEYSYDGFTVPSRVVVGNHFGTKDFLPFFKSDLISVQYF